MDADRFRRLALSLPHALETMQWGGKIVFWVGDKAIGGKMFAIADPEAVRGGSALASFSAGPERYHGLLEREGLIPAPHLARIFWIAATEWDALTTVEWREQLSAAHGRTLSRMTPRTRDVLAAPADVQRRLIQERRRVLAERAAAVAAAPRRTAVALEKLRGRVQKPAKRSPVHPDQE